jgi:hypothetical protein
MGNWGAGMMRNWRILLLSGAVFVLGLSGIFSNIAVLPRLLGGGSATFGLEIILGIAMDVGLIWAGFQLPSRRASLRRRTTIVLGLGAAYQVLLILFSFGMIGLEGASVLLTWFQPVVYLIILGFALAHQLRPLPPLPPSHHVGPDDLHRDHPVVAPRIVDGPGWHDALLASLRETGMQETARPKRWPLFLGLGGVLIAGQLVTRLLAAVIQDAPPVVQADIWLVVSLILLPIIGIPAAQLRRRVQQARARRAEDALQKVGAKRPVFYLRSFRLDQAIGQPTVLELISNFNSANPEQQLTQVLNKTGPVIAIGRPGEELPSLGAARFYVADDRWQEKVADVATVAQLVVWASGTTLGLQWEITHLIAALPPEKLVLWAHPHLLDLDPDEREVEWSRFVDGLGTLFPKPLPKPLGETRFFAFGPDFEPIAFAGRGGSPVKRQSTALRDLLAFKKGGPAPAPTSRSTTASASVETAGPSWRPTLRVPRGAAFAVGAVAALILIVGLGFVWSYTHTAPPTPLGWNLLAEELMDDELQGDTSWDTTANAEVSTPRTPDGVHQKLGETIDSLKGHLFGQNWNHQAPGRLVALKTAAQAYDDAYVHGHASTAVATAYEGSGAPLVFTAGPNADNSAARDAFVQLLADVRAAHQPWIDNQAATAGAAYCGRIRTLFEAREALLNSEIALIDFFGQHHDWTEIVNDQGQLVIPHSGDAVFDDQMPVLLRARAEAAATLKKAEADATAS